MSRSKQTLAQSIATLARETRAPAAFVERVRTLFEGRGIPLDSNAAPFVKALDDAFRRHATVRKSLARAYRNLGVMQSDLEELNTALHRRLERLRSIRRDIRSRDAATGVEPEPSNVVGLVATRTLIVRGEYDLAIVPGPEILQ